MKRDDEAAGRPTQRPLHGVGAALPRKEDPRFLHGRGQYVGDFQRNSNANTLQVISESRYGIRIFHKNHVGDLRDNAPSGTIPLSTL